MFTQINTILTGKIKSFGPKGQPSAYRKTSIDSDVPISTLGLHGDEQADLEHHGGEDKAIMHYAYDHYSYWRKNRPNLNKYLQQPGAFGENISAIGFTEDNVCIGDRYKLGTATVEVSQGRQPCWKLGHHFSDAQMVRAVVVTGYCGWYYRVIETGKISVCDRIELLTRPNPQWSIAKVFKLLIAGDNDLDSVQELSELSQLSEHWRMRAQNFYTNGLGK